MKERFINGENLTTYELQTAFKSITGRSLPPRADPAHVVRTLMHKLAYRFEFEINKIRGYAWENGERPFVGGSPPQPDPVGRGWGNRNPFNK